MPTKIEVMQGIVLAIAAYFMVRFGSDAVALFTQLYDRSFDYGPVATPIARFLALGTQGRMVLGGAIAFLNYAAAILLLAHIVDRLFTRAGRAFDADAFGAAFLLVVLNVAVAMAGAILAMDAGAMRMTGFEMVATVAAAILSDLEHRWRLMHALDEFTRLSRPAFSQNPKPVATPSANVHWLDFGFDRLRAKS